MKSRISILTALASALLLLGGCSNFLMQAKHHDKIFLINYELGGGENHIENPISFTPGTPTLNLNNATKEYYGFAGWYDNPEFQNNPITAIYKGSSGDKILWARWDPDRFDVRYHLDGGINHSDNPDTYTIDSATINLKNPNKHGYSFAEWYNNSSLADGQADTIPQGSTGHKEFWAKWTADGYSISYHLNGGENSPDNPDRYDIETPTFILEDAIRDGFEFTGWYGNASLTDEPKTEIPMGSTGNKEFWAGWTILTYSITFNLNSGTAPSPDNPSFYNVETADITLMDPAKTFYTFTGWYDNSGFSGTAIKTIPQGSIGNKTYWAKWTAIPLILEAEKFTIEKPATKKIVVSMNGVPLDPALLNWTVSNTTIATVDNTGMVKACSIGNTVLNISLKADSAITTTAIIAVVDTTAPIFGTLTVPDSIHDNQPLPVSVIASDPGGGSVTVALYNSSTLLTTLTAGANNLFTCSYSGLSSETYTNLTLIATDEAGNTAVKALPSIRVKSTDSALSAITAETYTLTPAFHPDTLNYSVNAPIGANIKFTAKRRSSTATAVVSQNGTNPIIGLIKVTAEAGEPYTTVYTITVYLK